MRRTLLIAAALAPLAACNPPARSVSYFKAHPEETGKVLALCTAGTHRGVECDNAKAAQGQIQSDKRLNLYKQAFAPGSGEASHGQ